MGRKSRPLLERFWEKVNKTTTCWNWIAGKNNYGYGVFGITGTKVKLATHVSFEIENGPIPEGACVLHKCDNRACVNPNHLFLGTRNDNMQDMINKNRAKHPKGEDNHSILKEFEVIEIRNKSIEFSTEELSNQYKVSKQTIRDIINYKRWKHI